MLRHKQLALILVTGLIINLSFGQNKKDLTIAFAAGELTSPYYENDKARGFYAFDFDYHLTKRQILSANFNSGAHRYFDDILSNSNWITYGDGTNSDAEYKTFSILYKYKVLDKTDFSATLGTGAGIMTHSRRYPYRMSTTSYSFNQSVWSDLTFPVRLEFDYRLSKQFKFGLIGGFFIHPDFPILAYHGGARLSYTLR
jgi:hypothetical protein